MKPVALLLASLLVAPLALGPARSAVAAEASDAASMGARILQVADQRAAAFPNQSYEASMALLNKDGGVKKTMVFTMVMKDLEKQYINFIAPGDVAGMKVLMEDADTIYIYSPEFQKVRRVAAHTQNQGFLGSEFTPEDMKLAKLSPSFDAVLVGKTGDETTLTLTPKKEGVTSYAKLEIVIDSKVGGITKIRYIDGSGKAVREQTRGGWKLYEGTQIPTEIRMKNLKTGDETVITLSKMDVKTPISDDIFSRRTLLRG
ncbi:MAG: outer membrane lipoprotein-sorting protein [Nannocystaceae bacterium]